MATTHSAVWAVLIVGGSAALASHTPGSAAPPDRSEKQAKEAGPPTKHVSSGGIPVTIILTRQQSDARRVAKEIRQFASSEPGNQLLLPLVDPPSAGEVAKLLSAGTIVEGNTITLASGTTAVLVKVGEGDDHMKVFKKAFDAATIKRERMAMVLKGLPGNARVRLAPPSGESVVITGDLGRAAEAIRKAPAGTRVTVDYDNRAVAYPGLK